MDSQSETEKRPVGRPTLYSPELGERVEQIMAQGHSMTAAAGSIGVCRHTLVNWAERHPEFAEALSRGRAGRVLKLEVDLLKAESGPLVTSRIFALKNADPEEWRDRHEVSGNAGFTVIISKEDMEVL